MQITINGQEKSFVASQTLESIIDEVCECNERVIAEVNGKIIKAPQWACLELKNGDAVELVSFVGGG